MPVILDSPESTQVQNVSSVDITTIKIVRIDIDVDGETIVAEYAKGYMDGETFVKLKRGRASIAGNDFLTLASSLADGNKSMYDNIKDAVYTQLIAQGEFAGTIS